MKAKLINEKMPFEMVEFDFNPETLKYTRGSESTTRRQRLAGRRRLDAVDPAEGATEVAAGHGVSGRRRRARSCPAAVRLDGSGWRSARSADRCRGRRA